MTKKTDPAVDETTRKGGFARLLAPVPLENYFRAFTGGESLHIPGPTDKFDFLLNQQTVFEAIWRAYSAPAKGKFMLSVLEPDPLTEETQVAHPISPDEIETYLARHRPICVNDLGAGDPELARFAADLGREIGLPGAVRLNCYISSGSAVTRTHLDTRASHSIQILGAKIWTYEEKTGFPWPRSPAQVTETGVTQWMVPGAGEDAWERLAPPNKDAMQSVRLTQGDFLFVPAGSWHQVQSDGDSIAVNVSVRPPQSVEVIARLLTEDLAKDARWRAGLPPGDANAKEQAQKRMVLAAREALDRLLQEKTRRNEHPR